jgi:SNF2 family DNA or RNA helicase
MTTPFWDSFKRQAVQPRQARYTDAVYFMLQSDHFGTFISVVDSKNKAVETSYLNYSGSTRNMLRVLEQLKDNNGHVISWDKPADKIYLAEHPFIMEALRQCTNIRDANGQALSFADMPAKIQMDIVEDTQPEYLIIRIRLQHRDEYLERFEPITEQYVQYEHQLIEIPPLGNNFSGIRLFNTTITRNNLALTLSLLFSNFDHVDINYQGYRVIMTSEDHIQTQHCLIFEKIDDQKALFLRIAQSLPDLDFNILEQFDLYRYAEINDMAREIRIRLIDQAPAEKLMSDLLQLLKKHEAPKKSKEREEIIEDGNLLIIPENTAAKFIYQELPNLMNTYSVLGAEKLRDYKISTKAPSLQVKLGHNIDYFEGMVDLAFEDTTLSLADVLAQYKKQRYIKLNDGTHALLNEGYVRRLERLFKQKGKKVRLSFFDLPLLDDLIEETARDKVFEKSRNIFEGFNKLARQKASVPELNAALRPYQVQGFKWLQYLHQQQLAGCLADDMGLGKTLQTIAQLATLYPGTSEPSLIVMPRSLLFNWEREVRRFAPQISTYTFYGAGRETEAMRKAHLVFTTYATMRNEIEQLKDHNFHYVILDESQHIKNLNSQTAKAALLLRSKHRLALSGTPIENNLGELYSLFHFLNPAMFGTLNQFNEDYLIPIQKHNDKEATLHLRRKIYPFILRRLKRDVLKELPDKIEQTLFVEMSDDQKRLYEQRRRYYAETIQDQIQQKGIAGAQFFVFQAMNELRQIASIPENISEGRIENAKLELLDEQLMDSLANGHKALVFVNFLAAIERISERLEQAGVGFVSMTGATRDRESLINRFQHDPDCRVFLMTLKTGGVGLNLTAADTIFIYDPWWNVAAENQAIDRAHRFGQQNKVLAYKLIAQGSIEEKILQLQQLKKELFDNIISADGSALKSLTEEDIRLLLSK